MIQIKVFILSVIFFLVCQSGNGQRNTGDSVRKELTLHKSEDSNRVKALIALGYYLMEKKSDSAYLCAKESIELAKKIKWNQGLANGEILLSGFYGYNNQLDSSVSLLINALKIAEDLRDAQIIAKAHWHIGVSYYHMKYNDRAEYHALKSLEFANATKDEPQMLETFWLLGVLYSEQRKWREAEKYYNLAMPMAKKQKNEYVIARLLELKGMRNFEHKNFREALRCYRQVLLFMKQQDSYFGVAYFQTEISRCFTALKNKDSAAFYASSALATAKEHKLKKELIDAYNAMFNYCYQFGDYEKAIEYRLVYDSLTEAMNSSQMAQNIERSRMEFEQKKKDIIKQAEQEKKDNITKRNRNMQLVALGVALLIAIFLFIYGNQKQKAKIKIDKAYAELKATQEQLIQIEKKQAVSNERLRISRELHDEVGATLSSISIFSQAAIQKNESGNMADSKNILERIGETSRDVMGELNDAVWLINPLNDNLQKIIQRISNYALPLCRTNNIHFEINTAGSVENLALSVEERKAIYLIIKEAINNSLKYAAAKNLVIQFQQNHNALHISIKDDGNGFVANNASSGNGLNNMQQRAKDVNGKIDFNSSEQKGTEIILEVPITNIGD